MEITINIIGIIQARMGSTRLPEKVLKPLNGKPMLQHIVERVSQSKYINKIIVATTTSKEDDILETFCKEVLNITCMRGSKDDVLSRFMDVTKQYKSDYIVRITADDPLKDAQIIDLCIKECLSDPSLDYCSNTLNPSFPEGLDIEVVKTDALKRADEEAQKKSEREHVTPYIWNHKEKFKLKNIVYQEDLSAWRWTVDKPQDFEFVTKLFEAMGTSNLFSYEVAIEYIKQHPYLREINENTIRNEGYLKSMEEDRNDTQ